MQMNILDSNRWLGLCREECVPMAHTDEGPRFQECLVKTGTQCPSRVEFRLLSYACLPHWVLATPLPSTSWMPGGK